MPYITKDRRVEIDDEMVESIPAWPFLENAGELNYAITKLALNYLRDHENSYDTRNAIIGAMESAKLEFYRRAVVPHEDKKIQENGDVYV